MMFNVAINGFGRIGRLVFRAFLERPDLKKKLSIKLINDLQDMNTAVHLLNYDSVHGRLQNLFDHDKQGLIYNDHTSMKYTQERQFHKDTTPTYYQDHQIDLVLECSGVYTSHKKASGHLESGAKKVLISAPTRDADLTVVYGVNHTDLTKNHAIISNASCTTNCLAPIAQILNRNLGIEKGYMTTIHAYTGDQRLIDSDHTDLRRARAAGLSMIPTTTGAAKAVGLVLPELEGKLDGVALRVPTANVSAIDFTFVATRQTTLKEINEILIQGAQDLPGILSTTSVPLVSCDFNHTLASANIDLTQTQVVGDTLCRVFAWYDNEWAFAHRMLDNAVYIAENC